jgi:hypothetical protein
MARTGIVAEAATDVLAAALSDEVLMDAEHVRRIAVVLSEALVREGFRVTVPVNSLAAIRRRTTT